MLQKLTISSRTIKTKLKNYNAQRALIEYISNGIDAGANEIHIDFKINKSIGEVVEYISISDNGTGISFEELSRKFGVYGDSEKIKNKNSSDTSGKNGHGRLTFFVLSSNIKWDTVYFDGTSNKAYSIKMDSGNLEQIDAPGKKDEINTTNNNTGTSVTLTNILPKIDEHFLNNDFISELYERLSWKIVLKNIKIYINGTKISLNPIIEEQDKNNTITIDGFDFKINFIKWKKLMKEEESRFYFLNSESEEQYKVPTLYNRGGDDFFHSLYITSKYFDRFIFSNKEVNEQLALLDEGLVNQHDKIFIKLRKELNKFVGKKRRPFIEKYANSFIEDNFSGGKIIKKGDSPLEIYRYDLVLSTFKEIYLVEPKFLNILSDTQLKIFANLIDVVLEEGESTKIFDIIDSSLKLDKDEREHFANILKDIELSNILKALDVVNDRFKTLNILEEFVFNKDLKANEVLHLQTLVANHYWLFGEEYYLIGEAEDKFEKLLRKYHYILTGDIKDKSEFKMDDPNKNKEMDILMCKIDRRSRIDDSRIKNIVVELKHPRIILGNKEFDQIRTYMETILKEDRFNGKGYEWKFYLIGNKENSSIEGLKDNSSHHGKDVIFKNSKMNYTIYSRTWSDVIEENKTKLDFLSNELNSKEKRLVINHSDEGLEFLKNTAVQDEAVNI